MNLRQQTKRTTCVAGPALYVVMSLALLPGAAPAARAQAGTQLQAPAHPEPLPHLENRANAPDPQPPLDARITAPVTIPAEAFGHYSFGRELDLLELDMEPRGLTGYITLLGEKGGPDKNAPLTFFFIKTRAAGDSIYFLTQQIHRVSYEFSGSLQQSAPREKTLEVDYSLVGRLTVHHEAERGSPDKTESRQVTFKKVQVRSR